MKRGVAYLAMAAMGRAVICGKSAGILKNSRIFCVPIIPARALSAASTRKGTIGPSWTVAFGAIYYMKDLRRDGAIRHLDLSPDAPEMVRRFHCGKKGGERCTSKNRREWASNGLQPPLATNSRIFP